MGIWLGWCEPLLSCEGRALRAVFLRIVLGMTSVMTSIIMELRSVVFLKFI